ncbi:MAG TPA: hypothetical protein VH186_25050 [Chloroflexia bacterium]|nr:hypothetical protein [Chloroflexia bacterium]
MSLNRDVQKSEPKPLSKLQKRLLFIIQRNPGRMTNFDLLNLNVRLGGEKEIDSALEGLKDAGLLVRDEKRKWVPTERGASLVIPLEHLTR